MAKELPYFKFEPSEWLEGEIQVCSDIAIVCFINLCSGYWLKLGCISYAFALQKYCNRNTEVLQELIKNKIITLIDDKICINFLDKQLNEFKNVSEKRTEAANKRWGNKGKDAIALQLESKSNAIIEDKIIEDNSKEEILLKKESKRFLIPSLDEIKDYCLERKNNIDAEAFFNFYESKGWMIGKSKMKSWKAAIGTWEKNTSNKNNRNNGTTTTEHFEKRQADFDPVRAMQTYLADKERRASAMAERISKLQSEGF